jgi:E3 ubiquitin-protein ligase TM129
MDEDIVVATIFYFLLSFILVYPPTEIVTLGFTIQSIFSSTLGSEQMFFVEYHIKRILLQIVIHSFIPLGYFLMLGFYVPNLEMFNLDNLNIYWKIYLNFSILLPVTLLTLVYYWYVNNYENNFIVSSLKKLAKMENDVSWRVLVNRINNEYRAIDKFTSGSMFNRIYVTNNWLLKVSLYNLYIINNQNITLQLTHANNVKLTQEGNINQQFLNILVKPSNSQVAYNPFYICLSSFEYKDFKDKLLLPIEEAANIIIKQSLPEQFLDAFMEQISLNEKYRSSREVCVTVFL